MAAQVEQFKKMVKAGLERYPFADELLGKIEEKTKVSKMNLVLGVVGFTIIWLAIGYGSPFLCDIIGFIFPAYLSFKAVESADTRDDTQWLTYWIVYSYFGLLEFFGDYILFWIPFYSLLKCCFLVWLAQYNGAAMIYDKIVRPMLRAHVGEVDKLIDEIEDTVEDAVHTIKQKVGVEESSAAKVEDFCDKVEDKFDDLSDKDEDKVDDVFDKTLPD